MEHDCQCRRGGCKSSADHTPSLSNGHVHRRTGKPQQQRQPGATQQGRWRQPHVHGRQGQPQAPKTGIRAPHPDEKVAVAQERVSKLEAALRAVGDDDDTAPNLREALKRARQQAGPLSIPRQGCTMREFLGTGQEEGGSCQRVVFAGPDRVDSVECRGGGRGATVGDVSSRVGAPPDLQLSQSTCPQRCRGCVL